MQNRFMAGNLAGAVTARCRTELGDLGLATDMARAAVDDYAAWYAPIVLGGPLDQWAEVAMAGQLDAWLEQHPHSVIALFSRFAPFAKMMPGVKIPPIVTTTDRFGSAMRMPADQPSATM